MQITQDNRKGGIKHPAAYFKGSFNTAVVIVDLYAGGLLRVQMSMKARRPIPESAQCKIHAHPRERISKISDSGEQKNSAK